MIYLIVKMLVLLLIAGAIGGAVGWLLRGARDREALEARRRQDAARLHDMRAQRDAAEGELKAIDDATAAKTEDAKAALAAAEAKLATLERDAAAAAKAAADAEARATAAEQALADAGSADGGAPPAIDRPDDGGDDLRKIAGVGPKIEGLLHDMGIWHYGQIAGLTRAQVAWVDERLSFKGRIEREDWIGQAKTLAAGGETEFSKKA